MFTYTWYQWILLFFCYAFIGWCFESTYVSLAQKKLVNRGFLRGPILPIYGFGAIFILMATLPVRSSPSAVFFIGMITATALELVTGYAMEHLFKVRYWDYSHHPLNFQGYICLSSSLAWGVFSIFLLELIHPPFERFILSVPKVWAIVLVVILLIYFVADFIASAQSAFDLSKMMEQMTVIKNQIKEIESDIKDFSTEVQTLSKQGASILSEEVQQKKEQLTKEYESIVSRLNILKKSLLKGNPGSTSKKFSEALEELKQRLKDSIDL